MTDSLSERTKNTAQLQLFRKLLNDPAEAVLNTSRLLKGYISKIHMQDSHSSFSVF